MIKISNSNLEDIKGEKKEIAQKREEIEKQLTSIFIIFSLILDYNELDAFRFLNKINKENYYFFVSIKIIFLTLGIIILPLGLFLPGDPILRTLSIQIIILISNLFFTFFSVLEKYVNSKFDYSIRYFFSKKKKIEDYQKKINLVINHFTLLEDKNNPIFNFKNKIDNRIELFSKTFRSYYKLSSYSFIISCFSLLFPIFSSIIFSILSPELLFILLTPFFFIILILFSINDQKNQLDKKRIKLIYLEKEIGKNLENIFNILEDFHSMILDANYNEENIKLDLKLTFIPWYYMLILTIIYLISYLLTQNFIITGIILLVSFLAIFFYISPHMAKRSLKKFQESKNEENSKNSS